MRLPSSLRICVVVPYDLADSGGVKHHAVQLARVLERQGHEVTVIGPSSRESRDPRRLVVGGIVNVRSNGSDNRMALFGVRAKLKRFFADHVFDVIHVHEPPIPSLSYWTAWLTPDVPKLATFHAFSEAPSPAIRFLQRAVGAVLYPHFDHAIAVSPPAARHASQTWARPLPIVPNGIPLDVFAPALRQAPNGRSARILAIGKLGDERKGVATMVEAFRRLRAADPTCTLDLVGDGPVRRGLPEVDGIEYYPTLALEDLVARYRACDVFAAPSTGQESFGMVLLEAMAAGKPIVCSDIEGYRHVARPGGATFVPPRDPAALASAVRALLDDEPRRRAMSAFNLRYVRRFDWSVIARDVLDAYEVAMDHHRARRGARSPAFPRPTMIAASPPVANSAHPSAPPRAAERAIGR